MAAQELAVPPGVTGHATNVTTLVAAFVGFHAVLHHTAALAPSTAGGVLEPSAKHDAGGLALSVRVGVGAHGVGSSGVVRAFCIANSTALSAA